MCKDPNCKGECDNCPTKSRHFEITKPEIIPIYIEEGEYMSEQDLNVVEKQIEINEQLEIKKTGLLDKAISKFASRKLLVFSIATGLLLFGNLSYDQWLITASLYIGTQAALDAVVAWKHGKGLV